jgi:general secretion pathway protein C
MASLLRHKFFGMTEESGEHNSDPTQEGPEGEPPSSFPDDLPVSPPPHNWKARVSHLRTKMIETLSKQKWDKESFQRAIQSFDPQKVVDWSSTTFQKRGATFYGTLATVTLSTFFVADLTALLTGRLIPEPMPVSRGRSYGGYGRKSLNNYNTIFSRNLFNSLGHIPGDDAMTNSTGDPGGTPVKTTLPLNLIGTLIMTDELRSIATIEDKSTSSVYPMRIDDEIQNKIKVVKVEPRRVIFVNKNANRREYIELPEDSKLANPVITTGKPTGGAVGAGVEKVAPTQYNVSRVEVDKALADFNKVLTEARAVPNFENGVAAGYKIFQIVPGSIYDKLGIQNGDVITGLNGDTINDPGKAFEMLNQLKSSNHLELQVKKDGKVLNYIYDIR